MLQMRKQGTNHICWFCSQLPFVFHYTPLFCFYSSLQEQFLCFLPIVPVKNSKAHNIICKCVGLHFKNKKMCRSYRLLDFRLPSYVKKSLSLLVHYVSIIYVENDHTRSILWVITNTHVRTQNAGFYLTCCWYFLWVHTGYKSNCNP
jgi:hypothetical protein